MKLITQKSLNHDEMNQILKKAMIQLYFFSTTKCNRNDAHKRYKGKNGWLRVLKKDLKNRIDSDTLDNTAKLEAIEPVTLTMGTNKFKLDSHGALDKLKCIIIVRGDIQNKNVISI
jgi:hypothetical protein